jgi:hypothetical protein
LLTWYRRDFLANRSPSPENNGGATTPGICGPKPLALLARYDPAMHSWKTCQASLALDTSTPSLPTLPRWGCLRDGELWARTTPGLPTSATGSGLWPTPAARDYKDTGLHPASQGRNSPNLPAIVMRAKMVVSGESGRLNPTWVEWLMGWPLGWTALGRLETDKYQRWRHSHGGC